MVTRYTWRALSLAVCASLAATTAHAGDVSLAGLEHGAAAQQFIVHLQADAGGRSTEATLQQILDRTAASLRTSRGDAPQMRRVRTLAVGPVVVRAGRELDPVQAERWMRALAMEPGIVHVEVDRILSGALDPLDAFLSDQWAMDRSQSALNLRPAWDRATGRGQVVAIIDSGSTVHPDLAGNTLSGYDFVSDVHSAIDGDGRDDDASDPGDALSIFPSSWHGTHVAGTVAAVGNNGIGVAGTAFDAKVVHARVLGLGNEGRISDIADGMVWAAGGAVSGAPRNMHPAKVINASLGGQGACSLAYQHAVDSAIARGATVVVSAGNSNRDVSGYQPANCRGVIAVAASTQRGARADFSNYGPGITVTAPGQNILSTFNSGSTSPQQPNYVFNNGTSMAAPHVSGVIALMQSAVGGRLSPAQVVSILKETARPLPIACPEGCGAGLVDASAAVDRAIEWVGDPTQ